MMTEEQAINDLTGETLVEALAFRQFVDERNEWSAATFGSRSSRGPLGPLRHLKKEAREACEEPDREARREEICDCLFLVLDAAWRDGMSFQDITDYCKSKLEKNKVRKWSQPVDDQPVEHIR